MTDANKQSDGTNEQFEKVEKGLDCCTKRPPYICEGGRMCPYHDEAICVMELRRDALALIRQQAEKIHELQTAQTPRVLTLDEIRNSLKPGEVVWLEDFDKCDVIPGIRFRLINEGGDEAIEFHVMDGFIAPKLNEYGERWRCWNKKPTNAQRLMTAWKKQLLQYGDNGVLESGLAPAT